MPEGLKSQNLWIHNKRSKTLKRNLARRIAQLGLKSQCQGTSLRCQIQAMKISIRLKLRNLEKERKLPNQDTAYSGIEIELSTWSSRRSSKTWFMCKNKLQRNKRWVKKEALHQILHVELTKVKATNFQNKINLSCSAKSTTQWRNSTDSSIVKSQLTLPKRKRS